MRGAMLLSLFGILAAQASDVRAQSYAPRVGDRHADFVLPTIDDGQAVALSQFRGKKVLLIQFASW